MTLSKRHSPSHFLHFFSSLVINNVVIVISSGSKGQLTVRSISSACGSSIQAFVFSFSVIEGQMQNEFRFKQPLSDDHKENILSQI